MDIHGQSSYQRLKKDYEICNQERKEQKELINQVSDHLWDALKTATNETREHIMRALRAIRMYEKK